MTARADSRLGDLRSVTQLKLPARFRSLEVVDAVDDRTVGKRHEILSEVLKSLRLGDALEIFGSRSQVDKCPTELVLLVVVAEVVPLRRVKSPDRVRVEVIWISWGSDGNGARCVC